MAAKTDAYSLEALKMLRCREERRSGEGGRANGMKVGDDRGKKTVGCRKDSMMR